LPPQSEQDQIVRYLDWKVSIINKYINAKKKQIELLKERKQAIINQAVTKGLDMNVPMKESGIEWLGKIPAHWEVMKLKHFAKVNPSIHNFKYDDKDEVIFLPMENISIDGVIDNSIKKRVYEVKNGFSSFAKNDIIIAKITPCFENGKGAFLNNLQSEVGFGTTELINLRAKENILPEYLYWITMSSQFRILGERTMTGTAGQKRITKNFVSYFTIAIPDILEQEKIIETIKKQINETNKYINDANNKVQLLQEFRTRLISDVVTGKVNVQNIKVPEFIEDNQEDQEITEREDDE
jgi:type I restriction enzyme S subunit